MRFINCDKFIEGVRDIRSQIRAFCLENKNTCVPFTDEGYCYYCQEVDGEPYIIDGFGRILYELDNMPFNNLIKIAQNINYKDVKDKVFPNPQFDTIEI